MEQFLVKYPSLLKRLYPRRLSRLNEKNIIYLTFDDGPIPEVTPWVLEQLKLYGAKATFFCIGDNVKKHPELFTRIIKEGHSIGNHTHNHLNGWKTSVSAYVENVKKADEVFSEIRGEKPSAEKDREPNIPALQKLFRPPYGRIKNRQAAALSSLGYQIVMWDILSGDFDEKTSAEKCLRNVVENTRGGSIIVLHDSLKASKNLVPTLPEILKYYAEKGFSFKKL